MTGKPWEGTAGNELERDKSWFGRLLALGAVLTVLVGWFCALMGWLWDFAKVGDVPLVA